MRQWRGPERQLEHDILLFDNQPSYTINSFFNHTLSSCSCYYSHGFQVISHSHVDEPPCGKRTTIRNSDVRQHGTEIDPQLKVEDGYKSRIELDIPVWQWRGSEVRQASTTQRHPSSTSQFGQRGSTIFNSFSTDSSSEGYVLILHSLSWESDLHCRLCRAGLPS
jgi:hypothetical protein